MDNKDDIIVELQNEQKKRLAYAKAMVNMPLETIVKTTKSAMIQKYSKDTIKGYLERPKTYESKMREVVDYLCTISPQFCSLNYSF